MSAAKFLLLVTSENAKMVGNLADPQRDVVVSDGSFKPTNNIHSYGKPHPFSADSLPRDPCGRPRNGLVHSVHRVLRPFTPPVLPRKPGRRVKAMHPCDHLRSAEGRVRSASEHATTRWSLSTGTRTIHLQATALRSRIDLPS